MRNAILAYDGNAHAACQDRKFQTPARMKTKMPIAGKMADLLVRIVRFAIMAACFFVCWCEVGQAADLSTRTFFDDTMATNWQTSHSGSYFQSASAGVTSTEIQSKGYRETLVVGYNFQSSITYRASHVWTDARYDPLLDGPIRSIQWDVWYRNPSGSHYLNLLARQNDTLYVSPQGETASQQHAGWQRHATTIDPATFRRVSGNGPDALDFTTCAPRIEFGYVNFNENPGIPKPPGREPAVGDFHLTRYTVTVIPESRFWFTESRREPNGAITFVWDSMLAIYYVEVATELSNSNQWQVVPQTLHISSNCLDSISISTNSFSLLSNAFFRVRRL